MEKGDKNQRHGTTEGTRGMQCGKNSTCGWLVLKMEKTMS